MQGDKISECVEALCATGCDSVRSVIQDMEQGVPVSGTNDLTQDQMEAVLDELKAIMAIYDR